MRRWVVLRLTFVQKWVTKRAMKAASPHAGDGFSVSGISAKKTATE